MKQTKQNKGMESAAQPLITKKPRSAYERVRRNWAAWMTRRTKRFSTATWKLILALFIMSVSSYSTYVMIAAFNGKVLLVKPASIKKPGHVDETGEVRKPLSKWGQERIQNFRKQVDSLSKTSGRQALYDSILQRFPGLKDSIGFIEPYYQQPLKQK